MASRALVAVPRGDRPLAGSFSQYEKTRLVLKLRGARERVPRPRLHAASRRCSDSSLFPPSSFPELGDASRAKPSLETFASLAEADEAGHQALEVAARQS